MPRPRSLAATGLLFSALSAFGALGALGGAASLGGCSGASNAIAAPVDDGPSTPAPVEDAGSAAEDGGGASPDSGASLDGGSDVSVDASKDASPGGEPPTFVSKRGALVFSDDFSSASIAPNWSVIGGTWNVQNGKLVGSSPATERDPNVGHMMPVERVVIQFTFSFTGSGEPGIRLNHKEPTSPQHLLGVRFNVGAPGSAALNEMSGWSTTTKSAPLDTSPLTLVPGTTYTGVLEVFDRNVAFSIDGKKIVSGMTVDQTATPKNHLILAAFGASVTYDDVKVWQAVAP